MKLLIFITSNIQTIVFIVIVIFTTFQPVRSLAFFTEIIWRLLVQSEQPVKITRNTYYGLTLVPSDGIRTICPCGLNKGFSLKFCLDSQVRHEKPEEGWRVHRPKHCEYSNKDEDSSLNILDYFIYVYLSFLFCLKLNWSRVYLLDLI